VEPVENKKKTTNYYELEVHYQLLPGFIKLRLSLKFGDLGRWLWTSKCLACQIYNSWMPDLAEQLKGLVVWMSREITQACCRDIFPGNIPSGNSY